MKMNQNIMQGKWLKMKGDIQKAWGKLTDDELEQTKGDMKAVGGLIQQRYGDAQVDAKARLNDIYKRYGSKKDEVFSDVKKQLNK